MTTPKRAVVLTADGYTSCRKWKLVPVDATPDQMSVMRQYHGDGFKYKDAINVAPPPDPALFADSEGCAP